MAGSGALPWSMNPTGTEGATGIVIIDENGKILLVNAETERQFGYSHAQVVGQQVQLLIPDLSDLLPVVWEEVSNQVSQSWPWGTEREVRGRHKEGYDFALVIALHPLHAAERTLLLASVSEVALRQGRERADAAALEEQLEFERFVSDLSAKFINLPIEDVPAAVRAGLGRICQQVGVERGVFYNIGSDLTLLDAISWTADGVPGIDTPVSAKERFPWTLDQVMADRVVCFSTVEELPNPVDRESFRAFETKSALLVPLTVEGQVKGAVAFSVINAERVWSPAVVGRLTVVARVLAQVLARHARDEEVRIAAAEARQLKEQLQVENVYLRQEARERLGHSRVVGQSAALKRVLEQIEHVAPTDSTVLLVGETGTGKELFATHIHELGKRHNRSMVRVNCAAIPPTLMESELFGRERGAFTGALARQMGRFEMADKSTIFLDEIGDLPLDVQVKLLRVLEERTIERLGSSQPIKVDVRIIAATHRNLERRIAEGLFREDLYYRLNVFPVSVPPLRERVEDISLLVWRFVEEFSKAFGRRIDSIDKATFTALSQYSWPGNIRELRNVVERAMIVATGHRLSIPLPHASATASRRSPKLVDVEKEHIRSVLEITGWRIRGSGGAADRLGLKPTTLETRMAKLGLRRPGQRQEG